MKNIITANGLKPKGVSVREYELEAAINEIIPVNIGKHDEVYY